MTASRLLPEFTQHNRLLRLHTCLGEDALLAEYLCGWEALDHGGFGLQLCALSSNASLAIAKLIGAPVLLEMLCDDSRTELRPFHGHVRSVERVGSNGGFTRYRLHIQPWLLFLGERQDSFAFHDMSVIDICEQIFRFYRHDTLQPQWRWQVDALSYPRRSLTTQYQETDLAFVERLLAEEGIAYHFEHRGDRQSLTLGQHTLVLSDCNARLQAGVAVAVPFQRCDVTEPRDSIQQWSTEHHWTQAQVQRQSWDHRARVVKVAHASSDDPSIPGSLDRDTSGPYARIDPRQGNRRAQQHLEAAQVIRHQVQGQGSWRRLAPGMALSLSGHGTASASDAWICLRVEHRARNNLDVHLQAALEASLGALSGPDEAWHGFGDLQPGDAGLFYRNRFSVLPATQTYRPQTAAGDGRRLHPEPTVRGAQTAIVVGNGEPLLTDRDHRIKVQLHWQRGAKSASRRGHPQDLDNAPANGQSGTWVRVATGLAGHNWGSAFVPRPGQEVWIDFLEGSIDRLVAVKSLYNGQGRADAGHSRIAGGPSGSTANTPVWFPGNGHADVLHGFKTQDLAQSRIGTGGYRQLQLDHTPEQSRAQLFTTDQRSGLTLGHIKQCEDNRRLKDRGLGIELATQAHGAIRAGDGLLLSTARPAQPMDAKNVLGDLEKSQALLDQLADAARQHHAGLPNETTPLRASEALYDSQQSLLATASGQRAGQGTGGGEGQASAWQQPMLVLHAGAGLQSLTPQSQIWVAGTHAIFNAGADLNLITQGKGQFIAGQGLALYTQGDKPKGGPQQQTGIALHAASGQVRLQAQTDKAQLIAKRSVMLASTQAGAHVQGKIHLLLTAQDAAVRLEGGCIDIRGPGVMALKAQVHKWEGPIAAQGLAKPVNKDELKLCSLKMTDADKARGAMTPVGKLP